MTDHCDPNDVLDPETGQARVLSDKCTTCVFRPGNLMQLAPGRLEDLIAHNRRVGAGLTCHQTLPYAPGEAEPAWCRGFYDAYPNTIAIRIAQDFLGITEMPPPEGGHK